MNNTNKDIRPKLTGYYHKVYLMNCARCKGKFIRRNKPISESEGTLYKNVKCIYCSHNNLSVQILPILEDT